MQSDSDPRHIPTNFPNTASLITSRSIRSCEYKLQALIRNINKRRSSYNCGDNFSRVSARIEKGSNLGTKDYKQINSQTNHLSLQDCTSDDWSQTWKQITSLTNNIKILWFNRSKLNNQSIALIVPYLPNLRELCVGQNRIEDEGAVLIAEYLKNLRLLNINSNCISDTGAIAIVLNLQKLRQFFPMTNKITKCGWLLIKGLPNKIQW